jgi:hypothetical protein
MKAKNVFVNFFLTSAFLTSTALLTGKAFAANATLTADPSSGSYSTVQEFQVDVKINGGGLLFNAAKSTVSISPSVKLQQLTIGDCNFSFVRTPTLSDPSFAGVILGNYSNGCTVYTLSLVPQYPGIGYVSFSTSEVKQYKTAKELLSGTTEGRYSFSGGSQVSAPTPTQPPNIEGGVKYYDITYIPESNKNTRVALDPNTAGEKTQTIIAGAQGASVTFSKVPEGIHTLKTSSNGKELSSQIINVEGSNKNLTFGKAPKQKISIWVWIISIALVIIIPNIIGIIIYRKRKNQIVT